MLFLDEKASYGIDGGLCNIGVGFTFYRAGAILRRLLTLSSRQTSRVKRRKKA
jgi:hypothetical protein